MKKQLPVTKDRAAIPTVVQTPEEFAKRICVAHGKSVEAVLETGKILIEAKRSLAHGEWLKMFDGGKIPFGESTAEKLIKISLNKEISNSEYIPNLPTSWATLYELTKVPNLNKAIEEGKIRADMQGKDVKALLNKKDVLEKFDPDRSEMRITKYLQKEYDQWPPNYRKARFPRFIKSLIERICRDN